MTEGRSRLCRVRFVSSSVDVQRLLVHQVWRKFWGSISGEIHICSVRFSRLECVVQNIGTRVKRRSIQNGEFDCRGVFAANVGVFVNTDPNIRQALSILDDQSVIGASRVYLERWGTCSGKSVGVSARACPDAIWHVVHYRYRCMARVRIAC